MESRLDIRNPSESEFDFDPDVVSHWSQWLGHKQPDLLIIGQDFGNLEYFIKFQGRDDPENRTNQFLKKLLLEAGIEPGKPPTHGTARVYLANAVLCAKASKGMNAPLRTKGLS